MKKWFPCILLSVLALLSVTVVLFASEASFVPAQKAFVERAEAPPLSSRGEQDGASGERDLSSDGEQPPSGGPVNINTASVQELQTLPGIGPVLAARIVEYREANGPFFSPEEIMEVSGVGKKTWEKLREQITADSP